MMIAIATKLVPTMRPLGAMTKVLVIVDVPLVVSSVTSAWISISNFLIVKTTVSLSMTHLVVEQFQSCSLDCACNPEGSTSLVCDKSDGQCPCQANVTGRQCNVCQDGFKNYPNCTSMYP